MFLHEMTREVADVSCTFTGTADKMPAVIIYMARAFLFSKFPRS